MEAATVTIDNKKGLHARAAAKFVKTVASFPGAKVRVVRDGGDAEQADVSGSSILGLMMLGADKGSVLKLTAEGAQAGEVLTALKELIEHKFGETE